MDNPLISLGVDAGNGAFKLYSAPGGMELVSQVATAGGQKVLSTLGLRKQKAPLQVSNDHGSFYVGAGAHDYGRPVENLDVERFNGTPEMKALLHGSLTRYQQRYGKFAGPLTIVVGLPNEVLTGDQAGQNLENVKRWMRGPHAWKADGESYSVEIADVKVASQVTGGLFDYLLNAEGHFIPERKGAFTHEVGVISIGFGTVELMVVNDRTPVQRFTTSSASGVRRLLELVNDQGAYSLGELDTQLRAGQLDISTDLPIWESKMTGFVEKKWGKFWKRFAAVLIVGGGAILLKDRLLYHFGGKAYIPDQPVQAIARVVSPDPAPASTQQRQVAHDTRPASKTPAWECHIHLRLRVGQDDDLIAFLSSLPPRRRALALKVALRSGGMHPCQVIDETLDEELGPAADDFIK